ncbi:MAG: hypothetical protein HY292_16295 [Planctomycetes bacterium]|nr:hypothetical protein [Planctomycetota bacterium]
MNEPNKGWLSSGLTLPVLILVVGVILVIATRGGVAPSGGRDGRIVGEALELIREKYVSEVDSRKLAYEGIDGMLKSLDPYSEFFGPEAKSEFREETEGEFTGIGIVIDTAQRGPGVVVLYALNGSPSDRA